MHILFEIMKFTDRYYFESVFELATDGPEFTIDTSIDELGQKLDLPPFLEPM